MIGSRSRQRSIDNAVDNLLSSPQFQAQLSEALARLHTGLLNVIIERLAYRPLRHISRLAPLISAIGVSIVLQNAVFLWISDQSVAFPQPIAIRQLEIGGG